MAALVGALVILDLYSAPTPPWPPRSWTGPNTSAGKTHCWTGLAEEPTCISTPLAMTAGVRETNPRPEAYGPRLGCIPAMPHEPPPWHSAMGHCRVGGSVIHTPSFAGPMSAYLGWNTSITLSELCL